jgi:NAD-dependent dihydropyrimidine dehydrogenase PreA subunit
MIELVSESRCIRCDICIRVCPTDVFERGSDGLPEISRQQDCQTCFMCEAWCPEDALFVAPETQPAPAGSACHDEQYLVSSGLLGSYRRELGWGKGRSSTAATDATFSVLRSLHGPPPPIRPDAVREPAAEATRK